MLNKTNSELHRKQGVFTEGMQNRVLRFVCIGYMLRDPSVLSLILTTNPYPNHY